MVEDRGINLNVLGVKDAGGGVVDVQFEINLPKAGDVLRWFRRTHCLSCKRHEILSSVVSCSGPVLHLRKAAVESYSASLKIGEMASMADVLDILAIEAKCTIAKVLVDYTTRRLKAKDLVEKRTGV